jgi:hypothetical protein
MNISCVHCDIPKYLTLSASATFGSSYHRSAEDLNPVSGMPSLDHRLARVNRDPN